MSAKFFQRDLPIYFATIGGLIIIGHYFFSKTPILEASRTTVLNWTTLCAAFSFFVGAVGTAKLHILRITSKHESARDRFLSTIVIGTAILFVVVGVSFKNLTASPEYTMLFSNISAGLQSAIRGIMYFSALIAAYMALRSTSIEGAIFFVTSVVYMLRGMAAGLVYFPWSEAIGKWLSSVPQSATMRGGFIAATIGAIVLAVRVMVGAERSVEEMMAAEGT
jgi:hypothetical protein